MNKANECTCPSGDGSLVHPCPAHPAVEQAGGDERAAFKTAYLAEFDCDADGDDNMAHSNTAWRAWKMARAALAQPSPAGEYGDAYQGAREDIAIWKRRALEAEQALRQAHNGQTFMGEPLVQPYEAPREKVNALFKVLGFSGTASVGDILDAALERLQAQPSPALPPFAEKVLAKLRRFYDCASDFESGGVDIGRHWLDLLTQLGLLNRVQRSPALWEISQQGEDLLGMPQPSPAQAEAERPALWAVHAQGPDELYAAFTREDAEKHAAELNALPMPEGIAVGAVVVPSPWPAVQHWQYLAEQEQDHKNEIAGRLRQLERICEGLPQDAIDGGWTVQGIRGYAKRLEDQLKAALAEVEALRAELQSQRERNTELIFKLGSATNGWGRCEKERDAALARVEQQERTIAGMNEAHAKLADLYEAAQTQHSVPVAREQLERLVRILDAHNYAKDAEALMALLAAAPAQAQHSVPEISGIGRDAEHPRAVVLYLRNEPSEEDMRAIQNFLRAISADVLTQAQHSVPEGYALIPVRETEAMHDAVMALLYKGVARTDTQKLLDAYIAAAPGKEGV